jgi:hypothetical protein
MRYSGYAGPPKQDSGVLLLPQPSEPNSVPCVRERTLPTEPPLVGEVSANFLGLEGCRVVSSADPLRSYYRFSRPELLLFLPSTSPTSGGRSVGIVRLQTKATE